MEHTEIHKANMTKIASCFNNLEKLLKAGVSQSTLPAPQNDQVKICKRMGIEGGLIFHDVPKKPQPNTSVQQSLILFILSADKMQIMKHLIWVVLFQILMLK